MYIAWASFRNVGESTESMCGVSGDFADFDDDSDTERLKTDSLPTVETLLPQGNQDIREPGTCSVLYRAPQAPACGQPGQLLLKIG